MTTYLLYSVVALAAAFVGAVAWHLFVSGPEVRAADTEIDELRAECRRLALNGRDARDSVHDLWLEWWTTADERDAWQADAEKWYAAYAGQATPYVPDAVHPVMAPAEVGDDELDAWKATLAEVGVSDWHSGLTGAWDLAELGAAVGRELVVAS